MQGVGWIDLIRRIPVKLQDTISFATINGSEIMAQDILRLDGDYILLRGRMAGSQDAGKVIILPYDQIVNLCLNKVLKEKDVQEIFGAAALPAGPAGGGAVEERPEEEGEAADVPHGEEDLSQEPAQETSTVTLSTASRYALASQAPPSRPENSQATKPAEISKSVLLARLRQRLAEQGKQTH